MEARGLAEREGCSKAGRGRQRPASKSPSPRVGLQRQPLQDGERPQNEGVVGRDPGGRMMTDEGGGGR
jgi:hypothetical protein